MMMPLLLLQIIPRYVIPPNTEPRRSRRSRHHQKNLLAAKASPRILAHQPLDEIPLTDSFGWNSLIRSHAADPTLVYRHMLLRGVRPDRHTLPHVLKASRLTTTGKQVHAHALKFGLASDPYVVTALMELYARSDGAHAAATVFDRADLKNPVSWTLMVKLYAAEGNPSLALQVFHRMVDSGADFDSVSLVTASKVCGQLKSLHQGRKVHGIARRRGMELDLLVGNALLQMYLECKRMDEARALFDRMPTRDALSWTTIICGYVQTGGFNDGLKLFRKMFTQGVRPDAFSVSAVLPACARMAANKHGREIHGHIVRHGVPLNLPVQNALMDMYVKSGSIEAASRIFGQMADKDAVSWTVMILGYSLHGEGEVGVALFRKLQAQAGVTPDRAAYAAVLHACSTALMVEEGRHFFDRITEPDIEHCAMYVGLLCRAGHFDEAREFVQNHRIGRDAGVLRAMLSGCRIHQNVKLGKRIAEQLIELEPLNADNYVLLSNVYAASAKWDMVRELQEAVRDMGLKARSACSWIELRGKVHVFCVGDVSHPRSEKIYWELKSLMRATEAEGCVVKEDFSLHDADQERECVSNSHSEMLATAFGLISTQGSATVRVTKNLRVCCSCHLLLKILSRMVARDIVLKDPERFHHFRDGFCSCRDRW